MNDTILKPALNISAFYLPPMSSLFGNDWISLFGNNWTDPRSETQPYSNMSNMAFTTASSNETYSIRYIERHGSCQALEVGSQ